jgi:cytochrome c oxidase assembly protein subunit 15
MNGLVFLEWFHRLVAATVSTLFLGVTVWVLVVPAFRTRYGALSAISILLIIVQIILGKLTVEELLAREWVFLHLGTALVFYGCLLVMALKTEATPAESDQDGVHHAGTTKPQGASIWPLALIGVIAVYGQALLGVAVSSNYAGLACPDWPLCNGMLFPAMGGAVGLQVAHRMGAYTVAGLVLALMVLAKTSGDSRIRTGSQVAFALVIAQIVLGVLNVFLRIPPWLSGLHLATAVGLWTALIVVAAAAYGQRRQPTPLSESLVTAQ